VFVRACWSACVGARVWERVRGRAIRNLDRDMPSASPLANDVAAPDVVMSSPASSAVPSR